MRLKELCTILGEDSILIEDADDSQPSSLASSQSNRLISD